MSGMLKLSACRRLGGAGDPVDVARRESRSWRKHSPDGEMASRLTTARLLRAGIIVAHRDRNMHHPVVADTDRKPVGLVGPGSRMQTRLVAQNRRQRGSRLISRYRS